MLTKSDSYEDDAAWEHAVEKIYGLKNERIENDECCIHLTIDKPLLGSHPTISTGAYGTAGGIRLKKTTLTTKTLQAIKNVHDTYSPTYILLKTRDPCFDTFRNDFVIDTSYVSFLLDLRNGEQDVWRHRIKSKTRNQVRKGLKNNFFIKTGHHELLKDFYEVISRCWRDLGTPTHSKGFYSHILNHFKDRAKILIIYSENRPISTALLLVCHKTIHHPFAATMKQYNSLSVNNVLYWKIIEYACQQGLDFFDMGRSHYHQGTYRYKLSWGAEPVQLYYNYLLGPNQSPPNYTSRFLRLATTAWKYVPLPLANRLGPFFIKHVL